MSEDESPPVAPSEEPAYDKSMIEYTVEGGEALNEELGILRVFIDRALATAKLTPNQANRLSFKLEIAMDDLRMGMVNEARQMLARVGTELQLSKSDDGFLVKMMRTQRVEQTALPRPASPDQKKPGFLQRLWKGPGKAQQ